jgi:fibronectin-binding autotransporter adhesin
MNSKNNYFNMIKLLQKSATATGTAMLSFLLLNLTFANPVIDPNQPAANVTVTADGNTTTVTQAETVDNKVIINWQSFNIAPNEVTHFQQPNVDSVALNRISPQAGASQIFGQLSSNGKIILVNQAGIYFGPNARVDVGSIIASTSDIANNNFYAGKYIFDLPTNSSGAIINAGTIKAADYGLVALIGASVSNSGLIQARLGNVVLASGSKFTLDLYGDQLVNFTVDQAAKNAYVNNSGTIMADGGRVLLTARAAQDVVDNVINMSGVIQAQGIEEHPGEIVLLGGDEGVVHVTGDLTATSASSKGGKIHIAGKAIKVTGNARLDVSGQNGGGEILIGGGQAGQLIAANIANALTSWVDRDVVLLANAVTNGNGGRVIVWSDGMTQFSGSISATGGSLSGNGGFVETSGHYLSIAGIKKIDLSAPYGTFGTWLLDPTDVVITDDPTTGFIFSAHKYSPNSLDAAVSTLNAGDLGDQLSMANILVVTTNPAGSGSGNITINDAGNLLQSHWLNTSSTTLTLQADNNITLASNLFLNGSGKSLILQAGQTNALGSINLNGTLDGSFNLNLSSGSSGNITIAALIGSNTALTSLISNSNTVIDTSAVNTTAGQTYNNPVTINMTTVLNGGVITLPAVALNNANLTINTSALTSAINGNLTGTGDVTKTGNGTLILAGANSYQGVTQVDAGTLSLANINSLGNTTAINIADGATLDIALGSNAQLNNNIDINLTGLGFSGNGALTGSGNNNILLNNIILNNTTAFGGIGSLSLNGLVTGSMSANLIKVGTGALTLNNGNNNYLGATFINNGILNAAVLANAGSNSSLGAATGSNAALTLGAAGAATLNYTGNSVSTDRALLISTNGGSVNATSNGAVLTLNNNIDNATATTNTVTLGANSANIIMNGNIQNSIGVLNLVKSGSGNLILNQANLYSGSTTINAGTLTNMVDNAIPINSALTANGTFNLNGFLQTVANLNGSGAVTNSAVTSQIFTVNNSVLGNFSGVISGNLALTKSGSNQLTLSGNNSYNGATLINSGTLSIAAVQGLGNTTGITVANGATLDFNLAGATLANSQNITVTGLGVGNNGAITGTGAGDTINNAINFASNMSVGGTGTLNLNGIVTGNAAASFSKVGLGIVRLGGVNSFDAPILINAGILSVTNTAALGSLNSALITVANGGTLETNFAAGNTLLNTNAITVNGMGFNNAGALLGTGTNNILSNAIILNTASGVGGTGSLTLNGVISGNTAASVTKVGTGSVTFGNALNSYLGSTIISAGTLNAQSLANAGAQSSLGQAAGSQATIILGSAAAASLVYLGASTAFDRAIQIGGVGGGALRLMTPGTTLTLNGGVNQLVTGTSSLTIDGTNGNFIANAIMQNNSGTLNLIKNGAGTLTLNNANTYNGSTAINAGSIINGITNALPQATNLTIASGGLLNINNFAQTVASVTGSGTVTNSQNTLTTFTVNNNSVNTFAGALTGNLNLTKSGTNVLALTGANNTYAGQTQVNAGTLSLRNMNSLGNTTSTTVASGATLDVNFSAGTLLNAANIYLNGAGVGGNGALTGTGTNNILQNEITLSSASVIGGGGSLILNSAIHGASSASLTKVGSGDLRLAYAASDYLGATNINAGSVSVASLSNSGTVSSLGAPALAQSTIGMGGTGATSLTYTGGTTSTNRGLQINGTGGASLLATNAAAILTINGNINNAVAATNTFSVSAQAANIVLAGNLQNSLGTLNLNKTGANNLLLSGSNNSYSGTTIVTAGILQAGIDNALPVTTNLIINGGSFDLNGFTQTVGAVNGLGTVTNSQAGIKVFSVNNNSINNYAGILSGNLGLTMTGSGTLVLSGLNTYAGPTVVNSGTLSIANINSLGSSSSTTVNNGASLEMNFASGTLLNSNNIILNGNGNAGAGALVGTGVNNILQNAIVLNSASALGGLGSLSLNGVISGASNTASLTKINTGTISLNNIANTYTGATLINAGIVNVAALNNAGVASSLGAATAAQGVISLGSAQPATLIYTGTSTTTDRGMILNGNGTLQLSNPATSLTLTGPINNNSNALTIDTSGGNIIAMGILSGAGSLTKLGLGDLTLAGNNSYSGGTLLNIGSITATNAAGFGTNVVTVAAGAVANINNVTVSNAFNLNNSSIVGSGASAVNGVITLAANSVLAATNLADSLTLNGNINDPTNGTRSLSLQGAGSVIFAGTVGGAGQALASLTSSSATRVGFNNATVTTVGAQTFNNAVTIGGSSNSSLTSTSATLGNILFANALNGTQGLVINTAGSSQAILNDAGTVNLASLQINNNAVIYSSSITTTGAQNYSALTLANDVSLQSLSGDIIAGAINGAGHALTIGNAGANSQVSGVISNLTGFTKNGVGTLNLSNANTYTGPTTIAAGTLNLTNVNGFGSGAVAVNSGASLSLAANVNSFANALTLSGLLITNAASTTLANPINLSGDTALSVSGGNHLVISSQINDPTQGTYALTLQGSGVIDLQNSIGATGPLAALTTQAGTTLNINTASISTVGAQTYNGLVNLGTATNLITSSATLGDITFHQALNGNQALTLNAANGNRNVTFAGLVGNVNPLASLDVTGMTNLNNLSVMTVGGQNYNNGLTLGSNVQLTTVNNAILVNGAIDNADATVRNLTLNAGSGDITLQGATGAGTNGALANLILNSSGSTNLNGSIFASSVATDSLGVTNLSGGIVTTSGDQNYSDLVELSAATNLTSQAGTINFAQTINGPYALTIVSGAGVNFSAAIGDVTPLSAINISGLGNIIFANDVVSNVQNYNSNLQIASTINLTGSSIALNNGVSGSGALILNGTNAAANNFILTGNASQPLALNNITVNGSSAVTSTLQVNNDPALTQSWTVSSDNLGTVNSGSAVVNFNHIENLQGGAGNDNFILNGGALTGVIDGGAGINTLTADNVTNIWAITGVNSGQVTGTNGFNQIQNLVGGSVNDSFILQGGQLQGSIDGGAGNNVLFGDNVANTWVIYGANSGTVTGIGGGFAQIQNLIGGYVSNNFVFTGNGSLGGGLHGGSNTQNNYNANTLDYLNYNGPIKAILAAPIGNSYDIDAGSVLDANGNSITLFSNIGNLIGSPNSTLQLPAKLTTLHITGPRQGYINDPFNFGSFGVIEGQGDLTRVVFDTPSTFNMFTSTAETNGSMIRFVNIPYYSGNFVNLTYDPIIYSQTFGAVPGDDMSSSSLVDQYLSQATATGKNMSEIEQSQDQDQIIDAGSRDFFSCL